MRRSMIVMAGITCGFLAITLYQYKSLNELFERIDVSVTESDAITKLNAINLFDKSNQFQLETCEKSQNPLQKDIPISANYSILPVVANTSKTRKFLESIHALGIIGTHDNFQKKLVNLSTRQLLANMMLRRDEAAYLNTVSLTPNMLNEEQLIDCYNASIMMLKDLNTISQTYSCTQEQKAVLNIAMGRLTMLSYMLQKELNVLHTLSKNQHK